jgi:hypothetical protein
MAALLARPLGAATLPDLLARPLGTRPLPLTPRPTAAQHRDPRAGISGPVSFAGRPTSMRLSGPLWLALRRSRSLPSPSRAAHGSAGGSDGGRLRCAGLRLLQR